jgi:hypothetical protein
LSNSFSNILKLKDRKGKDEGGVVGGKGKDEGGVVSGVGKDENGRVQLCVGDNGDLVHMVIS